MFREPQVGFQTTAGPGERSPKTEADDCSDGGTGSAHFSLVLQQKQT